MLCSHSTLGLLVLLSLAFSVFFKKIYIIFCAVEAWLNIFNVSCSSCSGWNAPSPSNRSYAARVWTTFSSAATVNHSHLYAWLPHRHHRHLLPLCLSPPWPMNTLPLFLHLSVLTLRCHHTPRLSVLQYMGLPTSSQSVRPSQCSQSRPTVSRSMSSVGLPAASDANIQSKVGQLFHFKNIVFTAKRCNHVGSGCGN